MPVRCKLNAAEKDLDTESNMPQNYVFTFFLQNIFRGYQTS